jgi:hypothetical protein
MEPEGSSPCSQEASTGSYPEADQSKYQSVQNRNVLYGVYLTEYDVLFYS